MRAFIPLFLFLAGAFIGWKVSPRELKDLIRNAVGKVAFPVIVALLVTVLLLMFSLFSNVKVI